MTWKRFPALPGAVVLILLPGIILMPGCKSKAQPLEIVEVDGQVLLDGKPLKKVRVRFIPDGALSQDYIAYGETDDAGKFSLTCHEQPGACAGENIVVVEESDAPEHLQNSKGRLSEKERVEINNYFKSLGGRPIPAKYANMATTPLKVAISPGQRTYVIEMTSIQDMRP